MQVNDENKILYERLKKAILKNEGVSKKKKKKNPKDFKKIFKVVKLFSTIMAIGLNLYGHVKKIMQKLKK